MFTNQTNKKSFLIGSFLLLALVTLPVTLYFFQQRQITQSHAEKTVNLSFEPGFSPTGNLQIPAGSTFTLDVYLDPGANSVSLVKLVMDYDTNKFVPAGGFIPNFAAFPQVTEGPIDTPGKIIATLSIGSDLSKAIRVRTKIGSLALKALENVPANTNSTLSFDPQSQALSTSSNSSYDENVIAQTTPVTIEINKPTLSCGTSPGDSMLVIDTSGSMNDHDGTSGTKISNAIASANNFIDIMAMQQNNRVGLVNFATTATLDSPLTNLFSTIKNQVSSLTANGATCLQCGINKANQEISTHKNTGVKNAVIILTDGLANSIDGNYHQVSSSTAEHAALNAAANGHANNGTVYYTIGLGQDVDSDFLKHLALSTGGQYYYSPTTDQLNSIYSQISNTLTGGSVSGTVFNDVDGNGVFEPIEPGISGVLLQLYPLGSSTPTQLISTGSDGTFKLQHICNGTYTLKQSVPANWRQTLPSDIRGSTFNIFNGIAVTDKNFGDIKIVPTITITPTSVIIPSPTITPTPSVSSTPIPNGTPLMLDILLHGIGNSGDNANPTASSLSNKTPIHPTKNAIAMLYDINNKFVATASGQIKYSSPSGSFIGTVYTDKLIATGSYTIKVRSDFHLTRIIPGVLNLSTLQVNQIPQVALVAGDVNNDNKVDILDYNLILDCYSDLSPAVACNATKKVMTDLNDDGDVNQFDYNLFLREISTQPGD
jgi:Mg-chelatase subunit ChlD